MGRPIGVGFFDFSRKPKTVALESLTVLAFDPKKVARFQISNDDTRHLAFFHMSKPLGVVKKRPMLTYERILDPAVHRQKSARGPRRALAGQK
jgi:hypothetical protein